MTSDDNDSTYALWSGSGTTLILGTPVDSPPAGERRHQVRLRARGEDGDAWWAVRLSSGALVAAAAASFTTSPSTITGSWGFGAPPDGATVLYAYVTGQSSGVKIEELYLDMDSREAPSFTPQILDGSGTATTTISDTTQPTVRANAIDLDGLNARQYRYWVTLSGAIVWDTGIVSGPSVNRMTSPLDNGSYVLHAQIWTTLGQNTAYASDVETLSFSVSVGSVPSPENPTVVPLDGTPFYTLTACAPYVGDFDGDVGYIELQRVDCPIGGSMVMTGAPDGYASTPAPRAPGSSTTLYDFESTTQGWAGEGAEVVTRVTTPTHDGLGALKVTDTMTAGADELRFNDAHGTLRDLTASGVGLAAWVLVPSGTTGTDWIAHLELQDSSFVYQSGPTTALTPGTWAHVTFTPSPALMANCRAIAVSVSANNVSGTGTVYVDTVAVFQTPLPLFTPDLQVTVYAQRDDAWFPASDETLAAYYDTGSNQRSWRLMVTITGLLSLVWSSDGTSTTTATSTDRPDIDPFGAERLRVILDADDGAGGWTVTFQSQHEIDGDWFQVGDVVTNSGAGTTSLFNSSAPLTVGAYLTAGAVTAPFTGRFYDVEIRNGTTGAIIASPDFSGRLDGTSSFVDDQVNLWTVHSPAVISSPTSTTTVAMLGPLVTGQCADFVDFTLPRSGVGITCDHVPESCCSYYRARTVGRVSGDLRISDWSDSFDPGLPAGLIIMWPSTAASVPSGWNRVTALDGKYAKGIATSSTEPGNTGGAATHLHTIGTHAHDESHSHTVTGVTGGGAGSLNSTDGAVGTTAILSTHTHTRSAVNSATVASAAGTPTIGTDANDPARLEVVYIESDGTPLGIPVNALALAPDTSMSGWSDYSDATGRFLKGAAAAGNGGATVASALDSHTHSVAAHTHAGTSHSHTSPSTGATSSNKSLFAGPSAALWTTSHTHTITINSSTSASLASGGSSTSDASSLGVTDPPYRNLRARQNTSGGVDLPVGIICAWRGSLGSIPDFWGLCDGTGGTPDMTAVYPRGATSSIGTTGGSLNPHTHASSSTHNHTTSGHSHNEFINAAAAATTNVSTTNVVTVSTGTHTHSAGDTDSSTPTVGQSSPGTLASTTSEPPYEEVAFVQLLQDPVPPAAPPLFCLDWDAEEHLIRTTSPDGPLWAPVAGKFEWGVDRPFTSANGLMGSRLVTSAPPGGRNLSMTAAVESEDDLAQLHAVLARPLVLISPSDADEVWAAPVAESVRVVKIGRIRQVTATFIGTGPQPAPQLADVG